MIKKLFFLSLLIFLFAQTAKTQTASVDLKFMKDNQQVLPGQVINMPFIIQNNSGEKKDFTVKLEVPNGWKAVLQQQRVELDPKQKKLLLLSYQVANVSAVGNFPLNLRVTDNVTKRTTLTKTARVRVKENVAVSILFIRGDDYIRAGDTLNCVFRVQNNGNTERSVYLETQNCSVVGSRDIVLEPGASKEVITTVKTRSELYETSKKYLTIKANSAKTVYGSAYHSYVIYPRKGYKKDLYHRFPVRLSGSYLYSNQGDKPISGYQFELSGNGFLDPKGKHYLEILARGPNNNKFSFMGLYDQYYVGYKNANTRITVGERSYQFTPLTESSRYGLGTEAYVYLNNGFNLGVKYVKPRFYEHINHELAGILGYKKNDNNYVELYYITQDNTRNPDPVRLASLSGKLTPFKNTYLDVEYSRGYTGETSDDAYRMNLISRVGIVHFNGYYYNTGKNYPGYFNNSKFYSSNLTVHLTKKLSVGFYAKEDFQNAQLDTFFITAPYSKSIQGNVRYKLGRNAWLRVFARSNEHKDRLKKDKFHYKTKSLNTQFYHRYRRFDYQIFGEYGKTTNFQLGTDKNTRSTYKITGNFTYTFNPLHSIEVFGNYSNLNSFISEKQRNVLYGFSVRSRIARNLNARLFLQSDYDIDQYYQNRNLMQFNLDYIFRKRHRITGRSYYTLFKTQTENPSLTFSISYAYQMGIPLKQIEQVGELNGVISDNFGRPKEGIVVSVSNETSITNENGEYHFSSLSPGRHLLFIDQKDLDIDETINVPLPIEVDILGERKSTLNFVIATGARVKGKFVTSDKESPGKIVIELSNEFDRFRIATNPDGNFQFPIVRPGKYVFKIYDSTIPKGYTLQKSMYDYDLKSGDEINLDVELNKRNRKIIFKSQDFILTPGSQNSEKKKTKGPSVAKYEPKNGYYSIQIGAFSKKKSRTSKYFRKRFFDFEKQSDNLYKYFVGTYSNKQEAIKQREKLRENYRNSFVVYIDGSSIKPVY